MVPVEFTRQSRDGRITLVIDSQAAQVRVLWARLIPTDLAVARQALRKRERITTQKWERLIGTWQSRTPAPVELSELPDWAAAHNIDAVIWTALPPRFDGESIRPSVEQVLKHLQQLGGDARERAQEYIERAPQQIDTEYRRRIENELGWRHRVR
jgi:hypothetical protein